MIESPTNLLFSIGWVNFVWHSSFFFATFSPATSEAAPGAVLETGVADAGAVLESRVPKVRRRGSDVRDASSRAGAVEPRATGQKKDLVDAERQLKPQVPQELIMSFVPDTEQRLWRTVVRRKYQLTCDRVRVQNQLESLLEEAQLKLSSLVSDLLGTSARRMLKALADGETSPSVLAALADQRLRATQQ